MKDIQEILDKLTEQIVQIQGEENLELIEQMLNNIKEAEGAMYQLVYRLQSQLVDIFTSLEMHEVVDLTEQEVIGC